ncbi:MAG: serine/threonine protein kinase [Gammaproteobacteria bacterium]|nr:serine/threonine protein kinase [Gammaproteobacteria bacterium]
MIESEITGAEQPYQNLTPDKVLDVVESLGYPVNGQFLALNSYENRVYQLGVEDAPPVVVKFYRPGRWSNEAIQEEHDFSYELAEYDVPIALPLNINGNTLHKVEEFRLAIFERKSGRAPELDQPQSLAQLGRLLARIHSVGSRGKFQHRQKLSNKILGHDARAFVLNSDFLPSYSRESYANITEQLLQLVDASFDEYTLPIYRRIHGDFHMGNVLVNDGTFCIVDLDDCVSGPAIQDIWMLLSGEKHEQEVQLQSIIEGYNEFFEFDVSELNMIEALRTLRLMNYAAWLAKRWNDPAFPQNFPWFDSPRYWEDHVSSLQEQLFLMQSNDQGLRLTF